MANLFAVVLGFPFLVIVGLVLMLFRAFVVQDLWQWFVVPTFHLPTPSLLMTTGCLLVVGQLYPNVPPMPKHKSDEVLDNELVRLLITTLGAWAAGFILHVLLTRGI